MVQPLKGIDIEITIRLVRLQKECQRSGGLVNSLCTVQDLSYYCATHSTDQSQNYSEYLYIIDLVSVITFYVNSYIINLEI